MDQNKIIHALLDVFGNKLEVSYLFGSHAAGRATDDSDLDLAVLTNKPMTREEVWEIAQDLAIRLGTEVDLINLMDCNTVLSMQIIKEGKLLFDPHHKAAFFETNIYRMYQDLQLSRRDNLADFKQRWAN